MLRQLCKQLIEVSHSSCSKPEIIIVYNSNETEGFRVEQLIKEQLTPCNSMIELKIIPAPGLHYYELKNFGAKHTSANIIIFLDSDVIPEDGWLASLLESFQWPEVCIVGGHTYIPPENLYKKAYGLIHLDHSDQIQDGPLFEREYFAANNVAFRREIFESCPFPDSAHIRSRHIIMVEKLQSKGLKIFYQPKSRTSHPAPNGLRHFINRAICDGHDRLIEYKRRSDSANSSSISNCKQRYRRSLRQGFLRLRKRFRQAGLGPKDTVGAASIVLAYLTLMFVGMAIGSFQPKLIRWRLSI
ncbi:MAG: glycosyltransferase family 2 protein [Nitrososphaerales archaeon]